jgi:hypothetical protein
MENYTYQTIPVEIYSAVKSNSVGGTNATAEHFIGAVPLDSANSQIEYGYNLYIKNSKGDVCPGFERARESRHRIVAEVVKKTGLGNAIVFSECPECPIQVKCKNYAHAQQIMEPLPPAS